MNKSSSIRELNETELKPYYNKKSVFKKMLDIKKDRLSLTIKNKKNLLRLENGNHTANFTEGNMNNSEIREIKTPRNILNYTRVSLNTIVNVNSSASSLHKAKTDIKINNIESNILSNTSVTQRVKRREKNQLGNTMTTTTTMKRLSIPNNTDNGLLDSFRKSKSKTVFESKLSKGTESHLQLPVAINSEANSKSINNSNQVTSSPSRNQNIKVVVRFRPLNEIESDLLKNNVGYICPAFSAQNSNQQQVLLKNENCSSTEQNMHNNLYTFDKIFDMKSTQEEVYESIGEETIKDVLAGYNGTIFAYGQSGTGKTFTMYGSDIYNDMNKGIIPRIISQIFETVEKMEVEQDANSANSIVFQVKLSFLQIYKEIIYDLLTGEKDLRIKEHPIRGIYVEGLSEVCIDSVESFYEYLEFFQDRRFVSETKLNQNSSRSHSILMMEITQTTENANKENFTKKGTLNLVDLAGSEKVSKTGAVGENLEQAKKINLSLSALGNVIHSLSSDKSPHVPYRDSKLTRLLQESLGGNYKTSLIVTCSPHSYHLEETVSSLKFAQRVKTIKNNAKLNIKLSYEELQKIINNLRTELDFSNRKIVRLRRIAEIKSDDELDKEKSSSIKDNENDNEPSSPFEFKFSECFLHKEKIDFLSIQVDQLKMENKEKDEIISKLEDEIKRLKEGKDLDNPFSFKHHSEGGERNINELYNEINDKLSFLTEKYRNEVNKAVNPLDNSCKIDLPNFAELYSLNKDLNNKELVNYLNSSSTINLFSKMNSSLNVQNEYLQNENQLLIAITEEILKSNNELSHNAIDINNNVIHSLYQSFKKSFVMPRAIQENGNGNVDNMQDKNSNSSKDLGVLEDMGPLNNLNNMNNLNSLNNLNNLNIKNSSTTVRRLMQPNGKKSSIRVQKFITRKNLNILKNMYTQNFKLMENQNPEYNNAEKELIVIKKTEKKLSKLKILQDFIVKSLKESENMKQTFNCLKEEFSKSKKQLEEIIVNNNINKTIEEEMMLPLTNTDRNSIVREKMASISTNEEEIGNTHKYDIDYIINEYIDSGSATGKFDGIALKYINKKLKWYFCGGLSAENKTTTKPIRRPLQNINADQSVKLEDSTESL